VTVPDIPHPGPDWKWALPAARVLTLVVLAAVTISVAAPEHRIVVGVALAVSLAGSGYGLRFRPERWPQRLIGLAFFAGGGMVLLAIDGRAPGWLACGVAIIAGLVRLPQRPGLIFAIAVTVGTCLAPLVRGDAQAIPLMAAICGAGAVLGLMLGGVRNRAVTAERLLAAEQQARESTAERDRLAERQRLAREIHDILAHTLSAQSVQLEGARLLVEHDGATAAVLQRIQAAQRLAREGIEETRRAVQSLRGDARPLTDTLRTLADAAGAQYREDGAPWPLGPQANLTVERTVQEGLTNARKHAPGAAVTIATSFGGEQLRVEVRDTGSGPSGSANGGPPGGGYGLAGMRERAALIGAELHAGPYGKGFRVCLTLPRDATSA
jgi:signal transduction histidine kinase